MVPQHALLDRLVAAYNNGDADGFAALLTDDAQMISHPCRVLQSGAEEVRAHYKRVFAEFPGNRTEVVHRVIMGNRVVDHERVSRSDNSEPFDVIAINTIENGKIARIELVSAAKAGE